MSRCCSRLLVYISQVPLLPVCLVFWVSGSWAFLSWVVLWVLTFVPSFLGFEVFACWFCTSALGFVCLVLDFGLNKDTENCLTIVCCCIIVSTNRVPDRVKFKLYIYINCRCSYLVLCIVFVSVNIIEAQASSFGEQIGALETHSWVAFWHFRWILK